MNENVLPLKGTVYQAAANGCEKEKLTMKHYATILLTAGLLTLVGCNQPTGTSGTKVSSTEVKREAKEAVDAAGKLAKQQKEEFEKGLQDKIDKLNDQVNEWQKKTAEATGDAKEAMQKKLDAVKEKRDQFAAKMKDLRDASGDAWEKLKDGVQSAYKELSDAVEDASDSFK